MGAVPKRRRRRARRSRADRAADAGGGLDAAAVRADARAVGCDADGHRQATGAVGRGSVDPQLRDGGARVDPHGDHAARRDATRGRGDATRDGAGDGPGHVVRFAARAITRRIGRSSPSHPRRSAVRLSSVPARDADPSFAPLPPRPPRQRVGFGEDFRRFFLRGVAALLPTLITLWLLVWAWNFLWENLGRHLIWGIKRVWLALAEGGLVAPEPASYIGWYWDEDHVRTRVVGVLLAVILVYVVGVFVGNFIGRTMWRLAEVIVMKVPLVRAIYPAVKQVTDFLLADRKGQFHASRVVAVQPHEQGIWSIGLVTGSGISSLEESVGEEMLTVFVPSTPTAFSGYVLVVPRRSVVELPLTVEEAMRLLLTGGVVTPPAPAAAPAAAAPAAGATSPDALPGAPLAGAPARTG